MVELNYEWECVGSDELGDGIDGQLLGQVVPSLVELLEQDNGIVGLDFVLGEEGSIGGEAELLFVHSSGDFCEGLGSGSLNILMENQICVRCEHYSDL